MKLQDKKRHLSRNPRNFFNLSKYQKTRSFGQSTGLLRHSGIKKTSDGRRQKTMVEGEREKKKQTEKEAEDEKMVEVEEKRGRRRRRRRRRSRRRACGVRSSYGTCY